MRLRARAVAFFIKTAKSLDEWLFGSLFQLKDANHELRRKISLDKPDNYKTDCRLLLERTDLESGLEKSIERLRRVEEKARSTLIGVTVAVAVLGSATSIFSSNGPFIGHGSCVRIIAAMLLFAGIYFLILSGFLALKTYQTGEVFQPSLHEVEPIATKIKHDCMLLFCIEQNNRIGTMRANRLSACFVCLRNGLFLVATLSTLIILYSI